MGLCPKGGIVSVALSLKLPLVAVSNCLALLLPGLSSPIHHKSENEAIGRQPHIIIIAKISHSGVERLVDNSISKLIELSRYVGKRNFAELWK